VRFIDLFCGIGGFRLGLEKANQGNRESRARARSTECSRPIGDSTNSERNARQGNENYFQCVWANDNDKYACQIYRKHFRGKELYEGDIRAVDVDAIPEHELVCAGFPCQSFSIAGKRRGFEDTRGTLFFEICQVLRVKRPQMLFLENVKGLLSASYTVSPEFWDDDDFNPETGELSARGLARHRLIGGTKGFVFTTILQSLDELGYDCQWQVLNSKDYGVPQNRERVFIIGHLRGKPRPKVFPIGEDAEVDRQAQPENRETIPCLEGTGYKGVSAERFYGIQVNMHKMRTGEYGDGQKGINEPSFTLDASPTQDIVVANALDVDGYLRTGARPRDEYGKPQLLPIGYRRIRRLTPLECERLQGFPDGWTEGISDTQRYKCLGNAVTVNVIEAIGKQLGMELV